MTDEFTQAGQTDHRDELLYLLRQAQSGEADSTRALITRCAEIAKEHLPTEPEPESITSAHINAGVAILLDALPAYDFKEPAQNWVEARLRRGWGTPVGRSLAEAAGEAEAGDFDTIARLRTIRKQQTNRQVIQVVAIWGVIGVLVLLFIWLAWDGIRPAILPDEPTLTAAPTVRTPVPTRTSLPESTGEPVGGEANGASFSASVSGNGRWVVFASAADNLAELDTNQASDIFLYDVQTERLQLISRNLAGESANGPSGGASISADGSQVIFVSRATDLAPGAAGMCSGLGGVRTPCAGIFLWERQSDHITRLTPGNADFGLPQSTAEMAFAWTSISADGQQAVFPIAGTSSETSGAGYWDAETGVVRRIDVDEAGQSGDRNSGRPVIDPSGAWIVFSSPATNLVPGVSTNQEHIYAYAVASGQLISIGPPNSNSAAILPWPSRNLEQVVFTSPASNLDVVDTNLVEDVFVIDPIAWEVERISSAADGRLLAHASRDGKITPDGRYVVFSSLAALDGERDLNTAWDIYILDLQMQRIRLVSASGSGLSGDGPSLQAMVSDDGRTVVFLSEATNLERRDNNGVADVFLADLVSGTVRRITELPVPEPLEEP